MYLSIKGSTNHMSYLCISIFMKAFSKSLTKTTRFSCQAKGTQAGLTYKQPCRDLFVILSVDEALYATMRLVVFHSYQSNL